jgi:hypothetical protein
MEVEATAYYACCGETHGRGAWQCASCVMTDHRRHLHTGCLPAGKKWGGANPLCGDCWHAARVRIEEEERERAAAGGIRRSRRGGGM